MAQQQPWVAIGNAFISHYYTKFDSHDRTALAPLFVSHHPQSHPPSYHRCPSQQRSHRADRFFDRVLLAPSLCVLQKETSLLTTESQTVQGPAKIVEQLQSLPRMSHKVTSVQFQPTPQNAILILVSGDIKLEGQTNELKFSEVFQLLSENNSFYIQNDIFSLNLS